MGAATINNDNVGDVGIVTTTDNPEEGYNASATAELLKWLH